MIILDGTMSSLEPGYETNAGQVFTLLQEVGARENLTVYYEAGLQWTNWRQTRDVLLGRGINAQIRRAYGVLAGRYNPGDRIILVGYSRGAFAVRSLSGIIGMVGLLQSTDATSRNVRQAWRHYQTGGRSEAAQAFRARYCHEEVEIEAIAVWDTVKALGIGLPILRNFGRGEPQFHDHSLGNHVRHGFHALALDETRRAYIPVMWRARPDFPGTVQQVWFRGTHGDVGGQLGGNTAARPLANIALVWMLEKLSDCAVPLPDGWRGRFPCDVTAPSSGTWQGWNKFLWNRGRREALQDPSESVHETVTPAAI